MKYIELFAGAGGLSRGLDNAGLECLAHAEIEPHARAVLRYRFPKVPLLGDVCAVDGDYWMSQGVDLISGGSPCQDLSLSGRRAGLAGSRSSLFHQQVRIWRESDAPYFLWENVPGAFSSNKRADFAAVLSAIVGDDIEVPKKWSRAGVAAGSYAVAAWRVFDVQYFGPPQRRARVFIVAARAGGCDPAEVLSLSESLCRHPSPRSQEREAVTGTLSARTQGGGGLGTDFECAGGIVAQSSTEPTVYDTTQITSPQNRSNPHPGVSHPLSASARAPMVINGDTRASADTIAFSLRAGNNHQVVVGALDCGKSGNYNGQDAYQNKIPVTDGRPRRLTPRECERLMSWEDDWTRYGINDKGVQYELKDAPRYKLCGNGVGSVVVEHIGRRLKTLHGQLPL